MKILVITSSHKDGLSIYDLLNYQSKLNDIKVINTIYYLYIPKLVSKWSEGYILFLRLLPIALKIRKKFKFNIIHSYCAFPEGFAGILLAKLFGIPSVVTHQGSELNEYYSRSKFFKKIINYTFSNADRNIIISKALKKDLCKVINYNNNHLKIIHNGVDIYKFFPWDKIKARVKLNLPLDKQIILYAGTFYPNSGINYLIDAFEIISKKDKNILLYILGDGDLKAALKRKIKNIDLENRIFIRNGINYSDKPIWLNAADLFILPCLNNSLPSTIFEALACGTPIVANRAGAISEIIPSEELGLLANPRDCYDLAKKILLGLEKIWNKDELVTRAKSFNWNKIAGEIQQCYENLFQFC